MLAQFKKIQFNKREYTYIANYTLITNKLRKGLILCNGKVIYEKSSNKKGIKEKVNLYPEISKKILENMEISRILKESA